MAVRHLASSFAYDAEELKDAQREPTLVRSVLREKDDVKEFYLGMKEAGVRGERRWKKKKTWR